MSEKERKFIKPRDDEDLLSVFHEIDYLEMAKKAVKMYIDMVRDRYGEDPDAMEEARSRLTRLVKYITKLRDEL